VIYFFRKGDKHLACETRLNPAGPGYELVVTTDGLTQVEPFQELAALLAREHELLQAWRAIGWRETDTATPPRIVAPSVTVHEEDGLDRRR
jgi:hypothetical protein